MDCHFCSQSSNNRSGIKKYPLLSREELNKHIQALSQKDNRRIGLVSSGPALRMAELENLCEILEAFPRELKSRLCVSLGKLTSDALMMLRSAGITRYHHNLECSESFYPKICSTQSWQERYATVMRAQDCGFSVCCGGLFGMGETWQQRLELIASLQKLEIEQIPLNFLHPLPGTPLAGRRILQVQEALRIIATFRVALPKATLRVCGGRPLVFCGCEDKIFYSGANALMLGNYLTTTGCQEKDDFELLRRLNFEIAGCKP